MRATTVVLTAALAIGVTACAGGGKRPFQRSPVVPGATIWEEPSDLASRDLYYGPWGRELAPDPKGTYRLVELKHTGVNLGMTVKDSSGREWSVKQPYPGGLDNEGRVEVTVSRLLSAVGYPQPPVYYLETFQLEDDWGVHTETGGRFRLKDKSLDEVDIWSWRENPFVGTQPYQGLLVLLMMFNSSDLKDSNNSLYEYRRAGRVERWYVARDIGAALGDTDRFIPRKGHVASFEQSPFVLGVNSNGHVEFAYNAWYKDLVRDRIKPDEVVWASNLLGRLSERQMTDAFRAGGYDEETTRRFISALRQKIEQGRSVRTLSAAATAAR